MSRRDACTTRAATQLWCGRLARTFWRHENRAADLLATAKPMGGAGSPLQGFSSFCVRIPGAHAPGYESVAASRLSGMAARPTMWARAPGYESVAASRLLARYRSLEVTGFFRLPPSLVVIRRRPAPGAHGTVCSVMVGSPSTRKRRRATLRPIQISSPLASSAGCCRRWPLR